MIEKFYSSFLGKRNKKVLKNKKPMRTTMTRKVKRSNQAQSSSFRNNWKSYSK
jgi:hypothetical protein